MSRRRSADPWARPSAGRTAKKPAGGPPTSSANTAEESIRGAQYQVMRASGVTMATVRWSESMAWSAMGTAAEPVTQSVRSSLRRASTEATAVVSSTR